MSHNIKLHLLNKQTQVRFNADEYKAARGEADSLSIYVTDFVMLACEFSRRVVALEHNVPPRLYVSSVEYEEPVRLATNWLFVPRARARPGRAMENLRSFRLHGIDQALLDELVSVGRNLALSAAVRQATRLFTEICSLSSNATLITVQTCNRRNTKINIADLLYEFRELRREAPDSGRSQQTVELAASISQREQRLPPEELAKRSCLNLWQKQHSKRNSQS